MSNELSPVFSAPMIYTISGIPILRNIATNLSLLQRIIGIEQEIVTKRVIFAKVWHSQLDFDTCA